MKKVITLVCPECGEAFEPAHHRQLFCTPAHKEAHKNRNKGRAAVIAYAQQWRAGRNSKDPARKAVSAAAFNRLCRMIDAMNAEDRKAGRADPIALMQARAAANVID